MKKSFLKSSILTLFFVSFIACSNNDDTPNNTNNNNIPIAFATCLDDLDSSDLDNDPVSVTANEVTISVGTGDHLTFSNSDPFGAGIGIDSSIHNSNTIFGGETILVTFDMPVQEIELYTAGIDPFDGGDSIGLKVIFGANTDDFTIIEWVIPSPTPANGILSFTVNASDLSISEIQAIELFTCNQYGLTCQASFLLNDVCVQ